MVTYFRFHNLGDFFSALDYFDYLNCIKEIVLDETTKMFGIIHQEILLY